MALNAETLYGLYNKGIIDYVPTDLITGPYMSVMTPMTNPYLNLAQQGGLYQNYGSGDSFTHSGANNSVYNTQGNWANGNSYMGFQSGANLYGNQAVGTNSTMGFSSSYGNDGITGSAYGTAGPKIGSKNNMTTAGAFGGFSDAKNSIAGGFNKTVATFQGLPNIVKGILSAGIIVATGFAMFRKGKKPKTPKKGFLYYLNPVNWFKKSTKNVTAPTKQNFWSKLNPIKLLKK